MAAQEGAYVWRANHPYAPWACLHEVAWGGLVF